MFVSLHCPALLVMCLSLLFGGCVVAGRSMYSPPLVSAPPAALSAVMRHGVVRARSSRALGGRVVGRCWAGVSPVHAVT